MGDGNSFPFVVWLVLVILACKGIVLCKCSGNRIIGDIYIYIYIYTYIYSIGLYVCIKCKYKKLNYQFFILVDKPDH